MMSTLFTTLNSLQQVFSRAFLIGAFIPTLYFLFVNGLILYLWSWPVHHWMEKHLFTEKELAYQSFIVAVLFFVVWVHSYIVNALTPLWIRTLEGRNWPKFFQQAGVQYHAARFRELSDRINTAVEIYTRIDKYLPDWHKTVLDAKATAQGQITPQDGIPAAVALLEECSVLKREDQLVQFAQLKALVDTLVADIQSRGLTDELEAAIGDVTEMITYAKDRSQTEHSRLLTDRNMEFGDEEMMAPTKFGNIGLLAQAYVMRAYHCNLALIWGALQRVVKKDQASGDALQACKSLLDFFVSSFWLSLVCSTGWAIAFACYGEILGAMLSATLGPLLCWVLWYGAAVEQYRVFQNEIITLFSAFRFEVLSGLRSRTPINLAEERVLWRAMEFGIGDGQNLNLSYQESKS
ncbi:MAG: hypothetical protein KF751_07630 [Nitrospira sp.]|nr:hypothetical protein [Nitrospira sp.]MBX3348967.1 hypothetical protein [Nitrospira sp.]